MNISRRGFFGSAAAFGLLSAGCRAFAVPAGTVIGDPKKLRLKFGVLSDVHLKNGMVKEPEKTVFFHALEWFSKNGADAVVFAGDITDNASIPQFECFSKVWNLAFPNGKRADGGDIVCVAANGNHDTYSKNWRENYAKYIHHAPYEDNFIKTVKGYTFLCVNWNGIGKAHEFINREAAKLPKDKPFFYIQHKHPGNTCYSSWAWGADSGNTTRALSKYGNAVAFSGHSHYTLTDERSIWQGGFTSIGTSSLSYTSYDYDYRENQQVVFPGPADAVKRPRTMRCINGSPGKQGMMVSVFDDHLRIERYDFVANASLGDDWIVPTGENAPRPYNFKDHAARRTAPEFPEGAGDAISFKLLCSDEELRKCHLEVKNEFSKLKKTKEELDKELKERESKLPPRKVRIEFPTAEARNGCQVFEYQVTAILLERDLDLPFMARRVMAPEYFYGPDTVRTAGSCELLLADMPAGSRIRFEITPMECFGKKGKPILSKVWRSPRR